MLVSVLRRPENAPVMWTCTPDIVPQIHQDTINRKTSVLVGDVAYFLYIFICSCWI